MEEEWRPVPGYEGRYDISNFGRIFGHYRSKLLKPSVYKNTGYLYVNMIDSMGKARKIKIHSLVMLAFVGPRPDQLQVCHNDGDVINNHLSNLRYDTAKNNSADKYIHGTMPMGENVYLAKLTDDKVLEIHEKLMNGVSHRVLMNEYDVDRTTIAAIANGKTWKHLGLPPVNYFWHPHFGSEEHYLRAKEFVARVADGERIASVARSFGINRKNAYRDYKNFVNNLALIEGVKNG